MIAVQLPNVNSCLIHTKFREPGGYLKILKFWRHKSGTMILNLQALLCPTTLQPSFLRSAHSAEIWFTTTGSTLRALTCFASCAAQQSNYHCPLWGPPIALARTVSISDNISLHLLTRSH
mmetsp:Transcript_28348/g.74763  ORF Transcript_28348/g.74763 Transcript_28348/m.74763 type:complete len:120 (-) Transcript_28348:17-376(-)